MKRKEKSMMMPVKAGVFFWSAPEAGCSTAGGHSWWMLLLSCTYPYSNLLVAFLSELYQVEAVVQQVLYAAVQVLLGDVRFLRAEAVHSPQTQLRGEYKILFNNFLCTFAWIYNSPVQNECVSAHLFDDPAAKLRRELHSRRVFVHSEVEVSVFLLQHYMVPMLIIQQAAKRGEAPWLKRSHTWERREADRKKGWRQEEERNAKTNAGEERGGKAHLGWTGGEMRPRER